MVVHGSDGLDEITTTGPTKISEWRDGSVHTYEFDAASIGVPRANPTALKGGDSDENARALRSCLEGGDGPVRDIVVVNAAGALVASGVAPDMAAAYAHASESVDSGAALGKLDGLIRLSNLGDSA